MFAKLMHHLNVGAQKKIVLGPAGWFQNAASLDAMVARSLVPLSLYRESPSWPLTSRTGRRRRRRRQSHPLLENLLLGHCVPFLTCRRPLARSVYAQRHRLMLGMVIPRVDDVAMATNECLFWL